jgi:hypothetical protein
MAKLTPCRGCKRHCRVSETACPFCGARRLAIGASVVVFATLGVGWGGDAAADASRDAGATPEKMAPDVNAPDGGDAGNVGNGWDRGEQGAIAIYGTPPSPRQGCW